MSQRSTSSAGLTPFSYQAAPYLYESIYPHLIQHGQTSYFSSCRQSGYGLSAGFFLRIPTVKVSLAALTLQFTYLWYPRRSERDVISHLRFGYALGDHSVRSREFEDNDDFFGRDSLDNLEAREPNFPVGSVFFIYV